METLRYYIRHQAKFLRDKFILVFKNEETKDFFEQAIEGCHFEELTSKEAENAARIGIHGKVISYGYTMKLTDDEMDELSVENWERTAQLLAEGNERLYKDLKEKRAKETEK